MQNWEYNYIVFKLETGMSIKDVIRLDQLNAAGREGWEMVGVMPLGQSFLVYTFKRPADAAVSSKVQKPAASAATGSQSRGTVQGAKPRSLRDIQVDPQAQAPVPQPEAQPGLNLQDILNSILGGGDGKL